MDFAKSVSLWRRNYFFAVLARSALRRVRVQSDLLDGTAFQASTLVACTEGPPHKEKYTYFALCFYFLGKLTRPRLVHCAHAAILRQASPDHTHCRRVDIIYVHALPLFIHCYCCVIHARRGLCTAVLSLVLVNGMPFANLLEHQRS